MFFHKIDVMGSQPVYGERKADGFYRVPRSLQFPASTRAAIEFQCKVPVARPKVFRLNSALPKNITLDVELDVSARPYSMGIIQGPNDSSMKDWAMVNLVMDTVFVR